MFLDTLKNKCAELPWEEDPDRSRPKGQFFLIKDTLFTNANFIITQILASHLKKTDNVYLVSASQNFAHYQSTLKRVGQSIVPAITKKQLVYIDLFSAVNDWLPADLPFVETTHGFYSEPPSSVLKLTIQDNKEPEYYTKIIQKIEQALEDQYGPPAIIIDNLTCLFDRTTNKSLLYKFVCSLVQLAKTHNRQPNVYILATCTFELELQRLLALIESNADVVIEAFDNPSGYQKDIAGQLIVKVKKMNKVAKFHYALTENTVEIKDTYTL